MQRRCTPSPTATALLKPLHDAAARPAGRSPDSSAQRALFEQLTLSDRTFPHLTMQWRTTRSVTLTYRCGGSAGFSFSTAPASRFTRGFRSGHLTRRDYSADHGTVLADYSFLLITQR
jgi:hypothetical protein